MNKMFKLCSGEITIASIVAETPDTITAEAPMEVMFRPAANGQLGINLFPTNPFASKANDQITFHKLYHVMFFIEKIDPAIEQQYIELTSGITVVDSQGKKKENNIIMP